MFGRRKRSPDDAPGAGEYDDYAYDDEYGEARYDDADEGYEDDYDEPAYAATHRALAAYDMGAKARLDSESKPTVFVSHSHSDQAVAEALRAAIETLFRQRVGVQSSTSKELDGGIKKDNIGAAVAAGAQILVIGTGLFSFKDYKAGITTLREINKVTFVE